MRASFSSRDADNHTAFIRIKTNASNEDEFIILPVEVEVTTGQLKSPFLIPSDQYYLNSDSCFVHLPSTWYILLHRDAGLWYASIARYAFFPPTTFDSSLVERSKLQETDTVGEKVTIICVLSTLQIDQNN